MNLLKRLAVVFWGPWLVLSLQINGLLHRVPISTLVLNGLVASAIVWLWFLLPIRAKESKIAAFALLLLALVLWNLPAYKVINGPLSHAEPYIRMLLVGFTYRQAAARLEPLRSWILPRTINE